MKSNEKWYTTTIYVHHETGEIITKSAYERGNYIIINKEVKTVKHEYYNERQRINIIRENPQTRLF